MTATHCTTETLRDVIASHGGVLVRGAHDAGAGACCVLEARSVCLGLDWAAAGPDAVLTTAVDIWIAAATEEDR